MYVWIEWHTTMPEVCLDCMAQCNARGMYWFYGTVQCQRYIWIVWNTTMTLVWMDCKEHYNDRGMYGLYNTLQ